MRGGSGGEGKAVKKGFQASPQASDAQMKKLLTSQRMSS